MFFHPKVIFRSGVDDVPFTSKRGDVNSDSSSSFSMVYTPFSTNMAPENRAGPKRKLIFQSSISGAMLVSGSVFFHVTHQIMECCLEKTCCFANGRGLPNYLCRKFVKTHLIHNPRDTITF